MRFLNPATLILGALSVAEVTQALCFDLTFWSYTGLVVQNSLRVLRDGVEICYLKGKGVKGDAKCGPGYISWQADIIEDSPKFLYSEGSHL
ncbi:hypothetical protein Trco_005386 [Trichoderma cornu-damae]|uniref:Uncharacterized protein n=1 Tax=Trichoderma cornu-damae TaxID=654480 RepID=A0A9P8TVB9_9HYPO|nr:hypothetical protein Trco_005386 [Trichoderma cornu-damae]